MNPPTREMTARDRRFVVDMWAHDARYASGLPRPVRLGHCYRVVDAIMATGPRVLCIATDERTVHAWAAGHGDTLLFAYTAPELRRQGMASLLLREMFGLKGPALLAHAAPKGLAPRAHYNPHAVSLLLSEPRQEAA